MGDTSIKLTVRTPNQKFDDLQVVCDVRWTIGRLKEYLKEVYPSKPAVFTQKLIFLGKLLQDHLTLREVFGSPEISEQVKTLHIVCAGDNQHENDDAKSTSPATGSTTTTEGIRQRRVLAASNPRSSQQTAATVTEQLPQQHAVPMATISPPWSPGAMMGQFSPAMMSPFHNMVSPTTAGAFVFPSAPSMSGAAAGAISAEQQHAMYYQMQMQAYVQQWQQAHHMMNNSNPDWLRYYQQTGAGSLPPHSPPITPQSVGTPPASPQAAGSPVVSGAAQNPPAAPQVPPQPAAPQDNQNQRLNAGPGGAIGMGDGDDEEDPARDRDWLDYAYLLMRALLTLGIIFFYSTTTRFALVCLLGVIVYLYQAGYLTPRRQAPVEVPVQAQENAAAPAAGGGAEGANGEQTEQNNEQPAVEPIRPSAFRVLCTFVVTFFTSLVPQGVPPIQAN